MGDIQNNTKEHLLSFLTPIILTFLSFLVSDKLVYFLLSILPRLQDQPIKLYLKIIILLLVYSFSSTIITVSLLPSKPYRPYRVKGKYLKIPFIIRIDYSTTKEGREPYISIDWLCPKHKIYLVITSVLVEEKYMHTFYCPKCKKHYYMKYRGSPVYVEEAESYVRNEILTQLVLPVK